MAAAQTFVEDIWYFAGLKSEFKNGQMSHKTIAGQPIVVGRGQDGKIFALRDICPHRAAPLSAGKILGDGTVECPYHGWRFGQEDGGCTHIPAICSGQKDPSSGIKVRAFPVREDGQLIWVYISADAKFKGEPDHEPPHWDMADKKQVFVDRLKLNCHVDHAVIGLMDPAHVSFLHRQWWWRTGGSMHEKAKKFEPRERGWAMAAHAPSSNSLGYKILSGKPITEITFRLPGVRTEEITVGKKSILSFTAVVPIDEDNTEITSVFFSDMSIVKILKPVIKKGANIFLNQDGDIIKLQAECLKHDPRLMLIDDADRQAKWYYQLKKEWQKSRAEGRSFVNPVKPTTLRWRS